MRRRTVRSVVRAAFGLALAGLRGSGTAFAQDPPPAEATPPASGEPAAAPATATPGRTAAPAPASPTVLTLHQGSISVDGDVIANMSKDLVGKPIQIVPNLYLG